MSTKIESLKESLQARLNYLRKTEEKFDSLLNALDRFPQLNDLSVEISYSYEAESIDFDYLTHEQTIEVIKVLGGKWTKSLNGTDTIDYKTTIEGVNFRIFGGQPPPSCQIIEETVIVPSQYTPETTKTIRRLKCVPEISGPVSN